MDIVLAGYGGMNKMDNELLQAIKQIIEPLIEPLASDMQIMKNDMQIMKNDIQDMKGEIQGMKGEIQGIKDEISEIKDRLETVEIEVVKTNIRIENDILPGIQALREGQRGLNEKFDNIENRTGDIEEDIIVLKVLNAKN